MYQKDSKEYQHHIATYGTQDKFGYKDFIPMFKAEKFNADKWADLFKKPAQSMWCRLQNIMTDSRCTIHRFQDGMLTIWDRKEM